MSLSNELVWKQVSSKIEYFKGKNICIDKKKCLNQFVDLQKFNKDHLSKEIVTKKKMVTIFQVNNGTRQVSVELKTFRSDTISNNSRNA